MGMNEICHQDIVRFATERVNMRRDDVSAYRQQVRYLRKKLEQKIAESEDYALMRMLLSGSLAKGTALRNLNDIDVAVYVKPDHVPGKDLKKILHWLEETLCDLYPNMGPSQIIKQNTSVNIAYSGSGLDVDVVPIIHNGEIESADKNNDADWDGLVHSGDGWLKTNIPRHVSFIRKRKKENPTHFRQIVRLLKYWKQQRKKENEEFQCKSFMIELIVSHLADRGEICMDDYVESLADFFNFIVRGGLDKIIVFEDYYRASEVSGISPIRVFDPANSQNNVASVYNQKDKELLVAECGKAADMIDAAIYAATKGKAQEYWRKILAPLFLKEAVCNQALIQEQ